MHAIDSAIIVEGIRNAAMVVHNDVGVLPAALELKVGTVVRFQVCKPA